MHASAGPFGDATYQKDRHLRRTFGITLDQYEVLLEEQDGQCAICGSRTGGVQKGRVKALAVDHDHATGRVRGLLCDLCNRGLGLFRDTPLLLEAGAAYLRGDGSRGEP